MTTAAASNPASTSTPQNDSPRLHDNDDGASDSIAEQFTTQSKQHQEPQHNHPKHLEQQNNTRNQISLDKQLPLKDGTASSDHEPERRQSSDGATNNIAAVSPIKRATPSPPQLSCNTSISATTTTTNATTTATATPVASASTTPTATTTNSTSNATEPADKQNIQLEQSPSTQQSTTTAATTNSGGGTNNNTEQKRPMNAFLLFCKRQRSLVREKYPNLENRGITKILGDWWSKLDKEQKSKYTDLARQHKEAFMRANPDFKWCKTPNVSNLNNNINQTNSTNNESFNSGIQLNQQQQQHQQHQLHLQRQQNHHDNTAATNAELLSMQSLHHPMDIVHQSSNNMDLMLTSRQQLGAPKPPKKRFLERNDSIYVTKNFTSNHNDTNSHGTDVVPYISLDQDTLDRVIDKAFSEDSNSSPSGVNTCKCSSTHLITTTSSSSSTGTNQTKFSSTSSSSSTSVAYNMSIDEPVDFSMNRTINTTRQQIINNLVERMLSEPSDDSGTFSKMNGTDSVMVQSRPPVRKDNPDDT